MNFSFEKIQNDYNNEISKENGSLLCPFYIDHKFFVEVEQQLNKLIETSDFCSVLICINIDNGILDIAALYNQKSEIYYKVWEHNGIQRQTKVNNSAAKKILANKPSDLVLIEKLNTLVLDSSSTYVIKKIGSETYYYAFYYMPYDNDYKSLLKLFEEASKSLK